MKEKLLEQILALIEKAVGESEQPNKPEAEVAVVKSVNEMQKLAMFLVLEPQSEDGETTDLHGHWYDRDTIAKACHDYNTRCGQVGTMHKSLLSDNDVHVVESYIAPCDFTTEDGVYIQKGSWLMWLHFPDDDEWQKVLDGTYDGVSIECSGVEYLLDDED
jgi:hypothetical protein